MSRGSRLVAHGLRILFVSTVVAAMLIAVAVFRYRMVRAPAFGVLSPYLAGVSAAETRTFQSEGSDERRGRVIVVELPEAQDPGDWIDQVLDSLGRRGWTVYSPRAVMHPSGACLSLEDAGAYLSNTLRAEQRKAFVRQFAAGRGPVVVGSLLYC